MLKLTRLGIVTFLALTTTPPRCVAIEVFRVTSHVYTNDELVPVQRSETLCDGNTVYDLTYDPARASTPSQVTVFKRTIDGRPERFILLDPDRRLRTELLPETVHAFMEKLKRWAQLQPDPLVRFAAKPQFQEVFDDSTGDLSLVSDVLIYRLSTTEAKDEQRVTLHWEYSDWRALLHALTNARSTPPFPRLSLNASLARYQRLPHEIRVILPAHKERKKNDETLRTQHRIDWRWSKQDRERVNNVENQLATYKLVDYAEFRKMTNDEIPNDEGSPKTE